MAQKVLKAYINNDYNGTNVNNVQQAACAPAPLPGHTGRKEWKPYFAPFGPVGILLNQIHEKAAAIDEDFVLHRHGWPPLALLACPYQELRPSITNLALSARTAAQANARKNNIN